MQRELFKQGKKEDGGSGIYQQLKNLKTCFHKGVGLPDAAVLTLVSPGLQILGLKEQAVLLYGRQALRGCYFALDRKRFVG